MTDHQITDTRITTDAPAQPFDPLMLTPETVDLNRFYTLDELLLMPGGVLEELWLACPDRPFYEAALQQAVDDTFGPDTVVSDIDRLSVIDECLLYYTGQYPDLASPAPRIPTVRKPDGAIRWFKVSDRIRERLRAGLPVEDARPVEKKQTLAPRTLLPLAGVMLVVLCLAFFILRHAFDGEPLSEADLTATAAVATAQSLLPYESPTPTPLALEDIDRPIRAGDDLRGYYPVLLELAPSGGPSRVFPVQQREVEIAEWQFAEDPDVASAVLGLVIRPVLGIPYTPASAEFLNLLAAGDEIRVRMSTGQVLTFQVTGSERVSRQEVSIFDQSEPGIVVVLLEDLAPDRLVVYGEYLAGQETPGLASPAGADRVPEGVSAALGEVVSITVLNSASSGGAAASPLPGEWVYLLIDLNLEALGRVDTGSLGLEVIDASGARYAPVAVDNAILRYPPFQPTTLEAGQSLRAAAAFLVPHSLADPALRVQVGDAAADFTLAYEPPGGLTVSNLDVVILEMKTEGTQARPGDLVVSVRLFNPHMQPITVLAADVAAVFSPVVLDDAYPIGPLVQAGGGLLPLVVEPGQALDVELRFDWNGDPFVGLQFGGYKFIAVLR